VVTAGVKRSHIKMMQIADATNTGNGRRKMIQNNVTIRMDNRMNTRNDIAFSFVVW